MVAFDPRFWKSLKADDRVRLVKICEEQLERYYSKRVGG